MRYITMHEWNHVYNFQTLFIACIHLHFEIMFDINYLQIEMVNLTIALDSQLQAN